MSLEDVREVEAGVTYIVDGERWTATKKGVTFPARQIFSWEELADLISKRGPYKTPKRR